MKQCYMSWLIVCALCTTTDAQTGVVIHHKKDVDPCYRLISSRDLRAAHLLHPSGRYVHTWHDTGAPQDANATGGAWNDVQMLPNGHLKVNLRDGMVIELDWQSQLVRQHRVRTKQGLNSPQHLPNGNNLMTESDRGHVTELDSQGRVVWEYWNSDLTANQQRMALCRVVPYARSVVEPLLDQFGRVKDVIPQHQENLKLPKITPNVQYKKLIREAVFYTEIGYYDLALRLLNNFQKVFPNDPEADYGYAVVYSAKRHARRAFASMITALEKGMPIERFTCGLGPMLDCLLDSVACKDYIRERSVELVHGPVLGDVTHESIKCWVRTSTPTSVQVVAREKGKTGFALRSQKVTTSARNENTAVILLGNLRPTTTYEYKVVGDAFETGLSEFTTAPAPGRPAKFSLGFGGGAGYTPKYLYMWDTIRSYKLPFFLLLGDNVYIDHPERPYTQQYCYYRTQSRPEFRRFTAQTAMYAIWDDHDFTFNDGKGSTEIERPAWKRRVWELFCKQWNNPYYGGGQAHPGCWFDFTYGDVDFFMLDCRYYREPPRNNPRASMLGAYQKRWLFDKLKNSRACFKVLVSSVPWAQGAKPGSLDTWDGHPQEREEIFQCITDNKIEGVILISADRHRSDAWRIDRPRGYRLYEFESSKLSNMHTHKVMPGSLFGYNKTCSFGLLDFDTTQKDPSVTYRIMTIDNQEIHRLTVYKSDLSFKSR